jgi:DNA (cytosine-5)-methyltransferase 1
VSAYYNEIDPKAAAWLRELIKGGHIAAGDVDERSIADVQPADLVGYAQCHFFAGIGGWSLALRLAEWPDDEPAWTGSCPCQPFSAAGKQAEESDPRHLWPHLFRLIRESKPVRCFGEQVGKAGGHRWLSRVHVDLESISYRIGACDIPAAGKGAPHIRNRLWWVADSADSDWRPGERATETGVGADGERRERPSGRCASLRLAYAERNGGRADEPERGSQGRVADARVGGAWERFSVIQCIDGEARRVEAGTFPLAHGVPARVGRLRGYGNAIVPQVAAEFIRAYREVMTQ